MRLGLITMAIGFCLASCATNSKTLAEPGNIAEVIKTKTTQELIKTAPENKANSMELGNRYFFGVRGAPKNMTEAKKWYATAERDEECGWQTLSSGVCLPMLCPSPHAEAARTQIERISTMK